MKRILVIIGLVLGTVGIGAVAAWAGSGWSADACNDNAPGGTTELRDPTRRVGYELTNPGGGSTWLTVCASDTPYGTPSSLWGGFVHVRADHASPTSPRVTLWCVGDPAGAVTTNCNAVGAVEVTDPNSTTPGRTVSATITPGGALGQTGAEVNPVVTANGAFNNATPGGGGSVGTGSGTCAYANSSTPTCPGGQTVAGVTVHEGDLPSLTPTNSSPPPACTGVNNTCPGAYVIVGGDTSHDTVVTTVAGIPIRRDVSRTCVQVNSVCPS